MRALVFNDVHTDLDAARELVEKARDADVVVGAGDFCAVHRELEATIRVLGAIDKPCVVVPGNNETDVALRKACEDHWPTAAVLHGETAEVAGVTFFGIGGGIPTTPWDWSHDLSEEEAERVLSLMPEGAVLVSHSPPYGHLDGRGASHFGSRALLAAIEAKSPPWMFCGHIHECFGQESMANGTRVRNVGPFGSLVEI